MPDRDFISTHVRSPWRPAARLWVREGATSATIDRIAEALAKVLRDGGLALERAQAEAQRSGNYLSTEERERLAVHLLIHQAVLAPVRGHRLAALDAAAVDREERSVLAALSPHIDRYLTALAEGRRPRVQRRTRPDLRQVLDTPVAIQL